MSGEASWFVASKLFSVYILSGQPVWTPEQAAPVQRRLEARFGPRLPAVEQLLESGSAELSLTPINPDPARGAPESNAAILDDSAPPRPTKHPHKTPAPIRAAIVLRVRVKP